MCFVANAGRFSARLSSLLIASPRRKSLVTTVVALSLALLGGPAHAQVAPDLTDLSVDDLMNVEMTSVSRKGQKLADTAAAVFVITQEDIRRSGATSIPEVLRIVPGVMQLGVSGIIAKPFDPLTLGKQIKDVLSWP